MIKRLLFFFFILTVFVSCRQNKDLIYLQNIEPLLKENLANEQGYKLRQNDILYVQILSMNKEIVEIFNSNIGQNTQNAYVSESSIFFQGFSVNDSGFVKLPVIGKVQVMNLTVKAAEELLQARASEYIKDATVVVKLANYKITLLGEVKSPGIYYFYSNQVNLLEAIGKCGDLTEYGNRKNVLIVRKTEEGVKSFRIDLTDKNLVISDNYILLPNDIVYVEPLKSKSVKFVLSDYGLIITTLASTLTTLVMIISLLKN